MRTARQRDSFLRDAARALGLSSMPRPTSALVAASLLVGVIAPLAVIAAPPPPPAPPTVAFQQFALGTAVGSLSASLSDSDTSLPLDELPNAWNFLPSVTDNVPPASFEVAVDDERMLVTRTGSGPYGFTLTRGHAGTTAAAHDADAVVYRLWPDGQTPLVTAGNAAFGVKVVSDLVATGFGEVRTEVVPEGWLEYAAPEGSAQCFYDPPGKTPGEFRTVNQIQTWTKTVYGYDSQGIVVSLPGVDDVELDYDFALQRAALSEVVPVSALGADGLRSVDVAARITQREFRRIYQVDELRYKVPNKAAFCYPAVGGALTEATVTFTQDEQQVVALYGLDKPVSEIQRVDLTGRITAGQTEVQRVRLEGMNAGTNEVQTASGLDFEGAISEVQTVTLTDFSAGANEVQTVTMTNWDAASDRAKLNVTCNGTTVTTGFLRRGDFAGSTGNFTAVGLDGLLEAALVGVDATGASSRVTVDSVDASAGSFRVTFDGGSCAASDVPAITVSDGAGEVVVVAVGAVDSGTGAITPGAPSGRASGDILVMFLETVSGETPSTPSGWTQLATVADTTDLTRLTVLWRRADGTATDVPTIADPGDHVVGRTIAFRNVLGSGSPFDVTTTGTLSAAATSVSIPSATTTVSDVVEVITALAGTRDGNSTAECSAYTNGNLSDLTERIDNFVNSGAGGGLCVATARFTAGPGSYGATSVTLANSQRPAMFSGAVRPTSSVPSGTVVTDVAGAAADSFALTYGANESSAITLGATQTEAEFEAAVLAAIDDVTGAPTPTSVDATGFTLGSTVGGLVVTFPGGATPLSVTSAVGTSGSVAITRDGQDSDVLQLTYAGGSAFPSPGVTMASSGTTAALQSALQSAVRTATGRSDATVSVTGTNGSASAAGTLTAFTVTFPTFDADQLALASTGVAGSITTTTAGGTASRFKLRVTVPGTSAGEYTTATLAHPVTAAGIKSALDTVLPNQAGSASKVDVAETSAGSISGSVADFTVTFSDWANTNIASTLAVCTGDATPVCPGTSAALGVTSVASSVTTEGKAASSFTVSYGASTTSAFGPGFAGNAMASALEGLTALDTAAGGSADVTVSDVSDDGFTVAFVAPSNTDVDALTVACTNCPTGVETITATALREGSALNEQFTLTFDVDSDGGPIDETQAVSLTDFDGADTFRMRVGGNTAAAVFAPGYGSVPGLLEDAIEGLLGAGADVTVDAASDTGFRVTFSGAQRSSDVASLVLVPGSGSTFTSAVAEDPKGSHSAKTSAALNGSLFSDAACLGAGCPAATATAITGALEALTPLAETGLPAGANLDVTISDARTQAPVDEEQRIDLVGFDGSDELSLAFGDGAASIVTAGGTYTRAGLAAALSDALESDTGATDPTVDVVGLVASGGSTDCGTSADPVNSDGFCFVVRGSLAATDVPSVTASGSGFTAEETDLANGTPTFDTFTVRFGGEFIATDYLPLVVGGSTFTAEVSEKVKGTRGRPTIQFLDSTQLAPVSAAREVLLDLEAPTFNDLAAIDPSTLGEASSGGTVPIALESSDGQANLPVAVEVAAFPLDDIVPGSAEPAFSSSFDDTFDANGELSAQIEFGIPCDVLPGEYLLRATIGPRGSGLGVDRSGVPFTEPASTTIGVLDVRPAFGIETNAGVYGAILNSVTGEFGFQNLYGTGGFGVTVSRKKVTTNPGTMHATGFASLVGACAAGDVTDGPVTVDFDAGIDEVQTVELPGTYRQDPTNAFRLRLDRSDDPTDAFPDVSDPIVAGEFTEEAIEAALLAMGEDVDQPQVDEVQRITLQNFGAECDLFTIAVAGGTPQAIKKSDPLCPLVDGQREYADTDLVDALVASGAAPGTVEIDGPVTDGGFRIRFIGAAGGIDQAPIEVVCPEFCEPTIEEVAKGAAAGSEPRDELVIDVDRVVAEGGYSFRVTFLGADAETDVPLLTVYDTSGFNGSPTITEVVKGAAESVDLTLSAPRGFEFIRTGRQYARVFAGDVSEDETFSYERPGDTLSNVTRQLIAKDGSGWEVLSARDPVTGAQTLSIKLDGVDAGMGIGRMPAHWKVFVSARVRFVGTTAPTVCQPFDFASSGRYEGFLDVEPKTPDDDQDVTVLRTSSGEPIIVTPSLPVGSAGTGYSAPLDARFGSGTYAFSAEGLPSGLSIDPATGVISGSPDAAGTSTVTVTVEDVGTAACGATTRTYVLEIVG